MITAHKQGELYPGEPENGQRRFVLTTLHKGCGGQVLLGVDWLYKAASLKNDGSLGCCMCGKQPLTKEDTYEDYC